MWFLPLLFLSPPAEADPFAASTPTFELKLSLPELSVLHSAALSGVKKYGGTADFRHTLFKEGEEVACKIAIDDPRLMDVWAFWMNERTAEIVNAADLERMEGETKLALQIAKQLNVKLAQAKASPLWPTVEREGKLVHAEGGSFLQLERGKIALYHPKPEVLRAFPAGTALRVWGNQKAYAQLEASRLVERRENTLEVFVMSLCPYGKQAEVALIEHLRRLPDPSRAPKLEVRYIFFPKAKVGQGATGYTSLQGEREVEENLVQIVLREEYEPLFLDYLLARGRAEPNVAWQDVCRDLGLRNPDLERILARVTAEREALIEIELAHAANYQIFDGSPTFVWEGKIVSAVQEIPAFSKLEIGPASCSAGTQ